MVVKALLWRYVVAARPTGARGIAGGPGGRGAQRSQSPGRRAGGRFVRLRIATSRFRAAMICWLSGRDSSLSCSITLSSSSTEARHDFVAAIAANLTTNCFYYTLRRAGRMVDCATHHDQSFAGSMLASVQSPKASTDPPYTSSWSLFFRYTALEAP